MVMVFTWRGSRQTPSPAVRLPDAARGTSLKFAIYYYQTDIAKRHFKPATAGVNSYGILPAHWEIPKSI
jgi:hypothetical protein